MTTTTTSVTLYGVTPAQFEAITNLLATEPTTGKKTRTKRTAPENTVSDEEDEDFGTKEMSDEDLDEDESNDGEDDESSVTFEEVKAAVNKYGEMKPEGMRAILATFNLKGPKELKANSKYWEPVYTTVLAKLKALKNKRK